MTKYCVYWKESTSYYAYIEADSEEAALEEMYEGRCEAHTLEGLFIEDEFVEEE